jgi:Mg-chelatase subunit ChlD
MGARNLLMFYRPFGGTALYDAMQLGLMEWSHPEVEDRKNSRWIVALTDGEDNASEAKFSTIKDLLMYQSPDVSLTNVFSKSQINLIVVGLGLHPNYIDKLIDLCQSTPNGNDIIFAVNSMH